MTNLSFGIVPEVFKTKELVGITQETRVTTTAHYRDGSSIAKDEKSTIITGNGNGSTGVLTQKTLSVTAHDAPTNTKITVECKETGAAIDDVPAASQERMLLPSGRMETDIEALLRRGNTLLSKFGSTTSTTVTVSQNSPTYEEEEEILSDLVMAEKPTITLVNVYDDQVATDTSDLVSFDDNAHVADGVIFIDGVGYDPVEFGASAKGHTNTCFYNTMCGGDRDMAHRLKLELGLASNALQEEYAVTQRRLDFTARNCPADTEVVLTYVHHKQRPVTYVSVVDEKTMQLSAATIWPTGLYRGFLLGAPVAPPTLIWCAFGHFQGLKKTAKLLKPGPIFA